MATWRDSLNDPEREMLVYGESLGLSPYTRTPEKRTKRSLDKEDMPALPDPCPDPDARRLINTAWLPRAKTERALHGLATFLTVSGIIASADPAVVLPRLLTDLRRPPGNQPPARERGTVNLVLPAAEGLRRVKGPGCVVQNGPHVDIAGGLGGTAGFRRLGPMEAAAETRAGPVIGAYSICVPRPDHRGRGQNGCRGMPDPSGRGNLLLRLQRPRAHLYDGGPAPSFPPPPKPSRRRRRRRPRWRRHLSRAT
ncbi:hypothetical protein IscW_ISCW011491 [Ixodes scapularis]|uniref:Uncharacterized protein n=1 Tax=Ixodes scapularis TaxID=6945 RepID=B7Q796_IXOSC|nr:hypothetical protein IscW_ISCW011491 [Ixodes scapularis]|eukprot:XP_002412134.1 hypothetical protein IscW_ISCW011491 [Ixodes scapularis]